MRCGQEIWKSWIFKQKILQKLYGHRLVSRFWLLDTDCKFGLRTQFDRYFLKRPDFDLALIFEEGKVG